MPNLLMQVFNQTGRYKAAHRSFMCRTGKGKQEAREERRKQDKTGENRKMSATIERLPDEVLDRVAARLADTRDGGCDTVPANERPLSYRHLFILRDKDDVLRDIIYVSACSTALRLNIGLRIAAKAFPLTPSEKIFVEVFGDDHASDETGSDPMATVQQPGHQVKPSVKPYVQPSVTVPILKAACKALGVPVSGKKADLVDRIARQRTAWLKRSHGGRNKSTGLLKCDIQDCKRRAQRFAMRPRHELEDAYALSPSLCRSPSDDQSSHLSRRRAFALAMAKYGSMLGLVRELNRRERLRLDTCHERRDQLTRALLARRPWLTLRQDSAICAEYIQGLSPLSLEQVVDATEEIQFLYQHTDYPSILRNMRASSRYMDREFGDCAYWRKREMVKDGLIEYIDDDTPDCSDIEDEAEYEQREEEDRRDKAKKTAIQQWIKRKQLRQGRSEEWTHELPRTIRHAHTYIHKGLLST